MSLEKSVLVFVGIQWLSLFNRLAGRPAQWRGRVYGAGVNGGAPDKQPGVLRQEVA